MKIKWIILSLLGLALIVASLLYSNRRQFEESKAGELQADIEYRLTLRTETLNQKLKYDKLMSDMNALIFLCDKYELEISEDLFVNPENGVWVFEKADGDSRIRFKLSEGQKLQFEALKIEDAPQNNFHFRNPKGKVSKFTVEDAGWHLVERTVRDSEGVIYFDLIIDGKTKSSMKVKSGKQTGAMHGGLQDRPRLVPEKGTELQYGRSLDTVWNIVVQPPKGTRRVYGYDLNGFELIDSE